MRTNLLHIAKNRHAAQPILESWGGPRFDRLVHDSYDEKNGWHTLCVDLDFQTGESWIDLGRHFDLFYETYSDSTLTAEIVYVAAGKLVRHLLVSSDDPDLELDLGNMAGETENDLSSWPNIAGFIDDEKWMEQVGRDATP